MNNLVQYRDRLLKIFQFIFVFSSILHIYTVGPPSTGPILILYLFYETDLHVSGIQSHLLKNSVHRQGLRINTLAQ